MNTAAEIRLWDRVVGAVAMMDGRDYAAFEYDPAFVQSDIQISPITMPLGPRIYQFPELSRRTFHGLPGLLADSLPDTFGNAVINAWLAESGRTPDQFSAIDRLCYTGSRGMGALEFLPSNGPAANTSSPVDIEALVQLASQVLASRGTLTGSFAPGARHNALRDILRVGTSAGGARAKAVIAWNPTTNKVRSGQIAAPAGFEYWLLKFDGVSGNKDKELDDPKGYGRIEYAYALMAKAAGITMTECRLFEEHDRAHFMTKRFDRDETGRKLHMQSLGGLTHLDYNLPGAHAYEQAFLVIRQLELGAGTAEEQFRRMAFNIVARNQDDHVKNIAFLMNQSGTWSLAPAFDMIYSYNPRGEWTSMHQMSMNGKRDNFTRADFDRCAASAGVKRSRVTAILSEVTAAVQRWPEFAATADVDEEMTQQIRRTFRLAFPTS